jgi:CCR4-NOT transcriptional regulation complex NOT5 subunit
MREFMKMTGQSISDVRNSTMVNTQAISKLEIQVGQLANHLVERDKGKLPSQPVNNSKACTIGNSSTQEHAHAIVTLRSGKRVNNQVAEPETNDEAVPTTELARQEETKSDNKEEIDAVPSTVTPTEKDLPRSFVPKAPYPERLRAPKKNAQFAEILEVFKQVQINILFLDAI